MRSGPGAPELNRIAEFEDLALEKEYFAYYINGARKSMALVSLLVGAVFLLLALFDLLAFRRPELMLRGLVVRGAVFLAACLVALIACKVKSSLVAVFSMQVFEILLVAAYQYMAIVDGNQLFMDQAVAYVLIVFAIYLVPGRWAYSLVFSSLVALEFLVMAPSFTVDFQLYQIPGVGIYLLIAICLGAVYSYNLQINRRTQYLREKQLEVLSSTDRLTGVYNRQKFDEVGSRWMERARTGKALFSLVMFDLDDFKLLNDTYGHSVGDRVLVGCTAAVRTALREGDVFARWGGEEFMILLPHTPLPAAVQVAGRLQNSIGAIDFGGGLRVTASFGVTQARTDDTTDVMVRRVDALMYAAKQGGKNRVCADAPQPEGAPAPGPAQKTAQENP